MGLLDFLFGKQRPLQNSGRVEDIEDYTEIIPDDHWTVDHETEDITPDDEWEEEQEQDWGDDWGEY